MASDDSPPQYDGPDESGGNVGNEDSEPRGGNSGLLILERNEKKRCRNKEIKVFRQVKNVWVEE